MYRRPRIHKVGAVSKMLYAQKATLDHVVLSKILNWIPHGEIMCVNSASHIRRAHFRTGYLALGVLLGSELKFHFVCTAKPCCESRISPESVGCYTCEIPGITATTIATIMMASKWVACLS